MPSILAALDFSDATPSVLAHAGRLASAGKVPLDLLHVIDPDRLDDLASAGALSREDVAERAIADARARLASVAGDHPGARLVVEIGKPYDVITAVAARLKADPIVMGAWGESSRGPGAGSMVTKCVRRATTNVLVVNPSHDGPFRSVVACVDLSEVSPTVIEAGARCAAADGSRLILLHAHSNPFDYFRFSLAVDTTEQLEAYVSGLRERLQRLGAAVPDAVTVEHRLEYGPNHGQTIIEYASRNVVDLIVVGTVGRSNLPTVLLGSTAERVLRGTPCSVLAVKPRRS